MSNVLINDEYLKAIGDAIREKNGTVLKYKPSEMAAQIKSLKSLNQLFVNKFAIDPNLHATKYTLAASDNPNPSSDAVFFDRPNSNDASINDVDGILGANATDLLNSDKNLSQFFVDQSSILDFRIKVETDKKYIGSGIYRLSGDTITGEYPTAPPQAPDIWRLDFYSSYHGFFGWDKGQFSMNIVNNQYIKSVDINISVEGTTVYLNDDYKLDSTFNGKKKVLISYIQADNELIREIFFSDVSYNPDNNSILLNGVYITPNPEPSYYPSDYTFTFNYMIIMKSNWITLNNKQKLTPGDYTAQYLVFYEKDGLNSVVSILQTLKTRRDYADLSNAEVLELFEKLGSFIIIDAYGNIRLFLFSKNANNKNLYIPPLSEGIDCIVKIKDTSQYNPKEFTYNSETLFFQWYDIEFECYDETLWPNPIHITKSFSLTIANIKEFKNELKIYLSSQDSSTNYSTYIDSLDDAKFYNAVYNLYNTTGTTVGHFLRLDDSIFKKLYSIDNFFAMVYLACALIDNRNMYNITFGDIENEGSITIEVPTDYPVSNK